MSEKIELEVAQRLATEVVVKTLEVWGYADVMVCGSIRREKELVGDIDLVVFAPALPRRVFVLDQEEFWMRATFVRGGSAAQTWMWRHVKVNLWACSDKRRSGGAMKLFATGSGQLNMVMRGRAKARGLKLNRYGLWRGDEQVAGATEREVFEALGMEYLSPPERSEGRF